MCHFAAFIALYFISLDLAHVCDCSLGALIHSCSEVVYVMGWFCFTFIMLQEHHAGVSAGRKEQVWQQYILHPYLEISTLSRDTFARKKIFPPAATWSVSLMIVLESKLLPGTLDTVGFALALLYIPLAERRHSVHGELV